MADEKKIEDVDMKAVDEDDDDPEAEGKRHTLLDIAQWRFALQLPDEIMTVTEKKAAKDNLMLQIKEDKMAPLYESLCSTLGWRQDAKLLKSLKDANEAELKELETKMENAVANEGDTEVRECLLAKADYFARIGDKDKAVAAYNETLEKSVGSASRIDVMFCILRLAVAGAPDDMELLQSSIDKTHTMVEEGGDWERRNLLKVYRAVHHTMRREFKQAAELLLDSIATFTCYELMDYKTFIFYTVLLSAVSLERKALRTKVVKSPEIASVLRDIPNLQPFITSLYKCKYADFFRALSNISTQVARDRFLSPHFDYFLREIRIVAYAQFLQSYRSVTLASMASAFGVSVGFLDRELSRFIAGGRLNGKIDKVNNVVETNRPDAKNAQYHQVLKQGDLLLNRIQKLTKLLTV